MGSGRCVSEEAALRLDLGPKGNLSFPSGDSVMEGILYLHLGPAFYISISLLQYLHVVRAQLENLRQALSDSVVRQNVRWDTEYRIQTLGLGGQSGSE